MSYANGYTNGSSSTHANGNPTRGEVAYAAPDEAHPAVFYSSSESGDDGTGSGGSSGGTGSDSDAPAQPVTCTCTCCDHNGREHPAARN
ncbi:hypothetical protein Q8F55_008334 [Vanrija albida]|uniref:Uncharacterized protein n=1 Tax=Vanrija albida TaxID=181172 RepID=A0ABR3PVY3_9TREE